MVNRIKLRILDIGVITRLDALIFDGIALLSL